MLFNSPPPQIFIFVLEIFNFFTFLFLSFFHLSAIAEFIGQLLEDKSLSSWHHHMLNQKFKMTKLYFENHRRFDIETWLIDKVLCKRKLFVKE